MPTLLLAHVRLALDVPAVVARVAELAEPWQSAYADSTVLPVAVLFVHLAGLLVGGGLALSADRATLRVAGGPPPERERQLAALAATHRPVNTALALSLASGVLLALADVEEFATSVAFWVKLALVLLLLANGGLMTRTEAALHASAQAHDDARLWGRLRTHALASAALWLAVVLAGTVLAST